MKTSGEMVKKALPYILIGGMTLGAAGCGENKTANKPSKHVSALKNKMLLPPNPNNVSVDAYADGKRTVIFKTTYPLLNLEVTQLCDNGTFIETTSRILKATNSINAELSQQVETHSKQCVGDQLSYGTLHEIPQPLPYPDNQNHHGQSEQATPLSFT